MVLGLLQPLQPAQTPCKPPPAGWHAALAQLLGQCDAGILICLPFTRGSSLLLATLRLGKSVTCCTVASFSPPLAFPDPSLFSGLGFPKLPGSPFLTPSGLARSSGVKGIMVGADMAVIKSREYFMLLK